MIPYLLSHIDNYCVESSSKILQSWLCTTRYTFLLLFLIITTTSFSQTTNASINNDTTTLEIILKERYRYRIDRIPHPEITLEQHIKRFATFKIIAVAEKGIIDPNLKQNKRKRRGGKAQ